MDAIHGQNNNLKMILHQNNLLLNNEKKYLIEKATFAEFRHYCLRFCRLCNLNEREHKNPKSLGDELNHIEGQCQSCPIIQFEAYRRLIQIGGINAVSLYHSKMVEQILKEIEVNNISIITGNNI